MVRCLSARSHRDPRFDYRSAVYEEADLGSGPDFAAQTVSLYDDSDPGKSLMG
jgi:hypothetical protein